MPVLIAAVLLMQYVVSVKAGLVNHVQGATSVAEMEMVQANAPIRTGPDGYAEILLTPGSFLRLGENSQAVLEDVSLSSVAVRIVRGPAVIEVIDISKDYPIRVTTGNLTTEIPQAGIYRFEDGVATVLDGKLQTVDSKLGYGKGWQVFYQDNYRARKIAKIGLTSLDVYSSARSERIASANLSLVTQVQRSSGLWDSNFWIFDPFLGGYTWLPRDNFRSPYGHRYYGVGGRAASQSVNRGNSSSSSGGGFSTSPSPSPAPPSNSGGSSNSGGGSSAPAVTVSTPSGERSTPSTYIESKSSPVGATVP